MIYLFKFRYVLRFFETICLKNKENHFLWIYRRIENSSCLNVKGRMKVINYAVFSFSCTSWSLIHHKSLEIPFGKSLLHHKLQCILILPLSVEIYQTSHQKYTCEWFSMFLHTHHSYPHFLIGIYIMHLFCNFLTL